MTIKKMPVLWSYCKEPGVDSRNVLSCFPIYITKLYYIAYRRRLHIYISVFVGN